jgi:hypothetical protein
MNKSIAFLTIAIATGAALAVSTKSMASESDDYIAYEVSRRSPNFHFSKCVPEGEFALFELPFDPANLKKDVRSCVVERNEKKGIILGSLAFVQAEILRDMGLLALERYELNEKSYEKKMQLYQEGELGAITIKYQAGFGGELEALASDKTTVVEQNDLKCGDKICVYVYWHIVRPLTETGMTYCKKLAEKNLKRNEWTQLDECKPEDYYFQVIAVRAEEKWKYLKWRQTQNSDPFIEKWQALAGLE